MQYNVDKYAQFSPDGIVKFTHNGKIGNFKSADVMNKVKKYGDCLNVSDKGVELGILMYILCIKLIYDIFQRHHKVCARSERVKIIRNSNESYIEKRKHSFNVVPHLNIISAKSR